MKNMIEANLSSSEQPGTNKPVPMKKTTMSVPEMRELLGLKKTESYWLVHRGFFKTKIIGGQMRVDLAQFREMEVFTQFSSDLDPATQAMLDHGHVLMELLKQPLYHPLAMWKEVVILSAASNGLLDDVALADLRSFREGLMNYVEANGAAIVKEINETGKLSDESREKLLELVRTYKKQVN